MSLFSERISRKSGAPSAGGSGHENERSALPRPEHAEVSTVQGEHRRGESLGNRHEIGGGHRFSLERTTTNLIDERPPCALPEP